MIENYLLDKYNSEGRDDHWSVKDGVYHASDVSKCPRKIYYKHVEGGEKDLDLDSCKNFERGNIVEDFAEQVLIDEYGYRHVGNSINIGMDMGGFDLVGETDPIIFGKNGVIEELFEVKSKDHTNFRYVEDEPQDSHVRQAHVYLKGLGLDECKLWYIKLPGFEDVIHTVEFSDVLWGEIIRFLENVHEGIINGAVPEREPLYDWECDYCDFKDVCDFCGSVKLEERSEDVR